MVTTGLAQSGISLGHDLVALRPLPNKSFTCQKHRIEHVNYSVFWLQTKDTDVRIGTAMGF